MAHPSINRSASKTPKNKMFSMNPRHFRPTFYVIWRRHRWHQSESVCAGARNNMYTSVYKRIRLYTSVWAWREKTLVYKRLLAVCETLVYKRLSAVWETLVYKRLRAMHENTCIQAFARVYSFPLFFLDTMLRGDFWCQNWCIFAFFIFDAPMSCMTMYLSVQKKKKIPNNMASNVPLFRFERPVG